VPGYELRLVDERGNPVKQGEMGELQISGPTKRRCYWNNHDKSRNTFMGGWTKSGDKYTARPRRLYVYGGRSDDMLQVSGIYVSPAEVEAALITTQRCSKRRWSAPKTRTSSSSQGLRRLKQRNSGTDALEGRAPAAFKDKLAPYKYPRWIEFLPSCRRLRRERSSGSNCGLEAKGSGVAEKKPSSPGVLHRVRGVRNGL